MTDRDRISIAILTGEQDDVAHVDKTLRDAGHVTACHWAETPESLAEILAAHDIEIILLKSDGFPTSIPEVVELKNQDQPDIPVIALQDDVSEATIEAAMQHGASDLASTNSKGRLLAIIMRELSALRAGRSLRATTDAASEYKRQFLEQLHKSNHAIALVQEGVVMEVNEAWRKLFRLASNDETTGLPLMDTFDRESHAALKGALVASAAGKWQANESLTVTSCIANDDANELDLSLEGCTLDDGPGVKVTIKIPEKSEVEPTKLVHDALQRDPSTLLLHRGQLLEYVGKRLAGKLKAGLYALAYLRIDKFSVVADSVGVIDSEEVLGQFAEVLRKQLHPRDIAGRFEGTSFLILLERSNTRDALAWGEQLCRHVAEQTFEVGDRSTRLTCTIGLSLASEIYASLEDFVGATLDAHRLAREAGGNRAQLNQAAEEGTKQLEVDAVWVRHLKSALLENRFCLAQQPIAGLRSDGAEMFDLLIRMLDAQGNSVLPAEFLPAAERNNLMKMLDRWMLKAAVEFCCDSSADHVFVRLSRHSVLDPSTVSWLGQQLADNGVQAPRLIVQVPVSDAAKHIKQTHVIVDELRKLGAGFALEHFNTDPGCLRMLDILKPDFIKIDGGLMHSLLSDTGLQEALERVIAAAADRQIKTIAEHVENANAMAVLFQLGLDFMQGHYVHEPEVVLQDQDPIELNSLADLAAANAG